MTSLIIGIVMPLMAAAQPCPIDSIVTRDKDDNYLSLISNGYDDLLNIAHRTEWVWENGQKRGVNKKDYIYLPNSSTITFLDEWQWNNTTNDWKGYSRTEYVYNDKKQKITEVVYGWLNFWYPKKSTAYTYYPNGKNRSAEVMNFALSGTTWQPSTFNVKIKDTAGRDSVEINYNSYKNGVWQPSYQKDYHYDAAGNKIQYDYWSTWDGTEWKADTREQWTYDAHKRETEYTKTTLNKNGTWTNNTRRHTEYRGTTSDKTRYEEYTGSGNTWVNKTLQITEYNTYARKTLYETYTGKNSEWIKATREVWNYYGTTTTQTLHETYTATNNAWVKKLREVTAYGASTSQKLLYEKYNGVNNAWQGVQRDTIVFLGTTTKKIMEEHYSGLETDGTWKGKSNGKTVNVYNDEKGSKTLQTTIYTWKNKQWVGADDKRWTYSGNNIVNYEWYNAYTNGAWVGYQKYEQTYSGSNLLSRADYIWENGGWIGAQMKTYEYTSGKKTKETLYGWDVTAQDWGLYSEDRWTYSGSLKTCEEHYLWDGTQWVGKDKGKTEYEYSGTKVIGTAVYSWQNGVWAGVERSSTTYTASGRLAEQLTYVWENNDWVLDVKTVGTYETNHIQVLTTRREEGVMVNNILSDTLYDTHGNNTLSGNYEWKNGTWSPISLSKTDVEYQLIAGVERMMYSAIMDSSATTDGQWVGKSKMEYTYDTDGYKTFEQSSIWGEGDWLFSWNHAWTYDEAHHTLKDIMYIWSTDYNQWEGASWSEYAYTGNDLTRVAMYNWDGYTHMWKGRSCSETVYNDDHTVASSRTYQWQTTPDSCWIGDTRTDYIRNEQGEVVRTDTYGWSQNDWSLTAQDGETYDDDDAHKLRSELHATWQGDTNLTYEKTLYYYHCD